MSSLTAPTANKGPRSLHRLDWDDVRVALQVEGKVNRVWCASPDVEAPPLRLSFIQDGTRVRTVVPRVETWTMMCVEMAHTAEGQF